MGGPVFADPQNSLQAFLATAFVCVCLYRCVCVCVSVWSALYQPLVDNVRCIPYWHVGTFSIHSPLCGNTARFPLAVASEGINRPSTVQVFRPNGDICCARVFSLSTIPTLSS